MADQATNVILTILRYIRIEARQLWPGVRSSRPRNCAPLLIDRPLFKAYNVQIHDTAVGVG